MSISQRQEARLLDAGERELVGRSHRPSLDALDDAELAELIRLLRERRDRARDMSSRQRREFRRKSAPSGVRPATDNAGTREKEALLAAAVKRLNKEGERRRNASARNKTVSSARRALAMKRVAGEISANRPASRTASEGMPSLPNERDAPSGAIHQEGQEIARRRGGGPR